MDRGGRVSMNPVVAVLEILLLASLLAYLVWAIGCVVVVVYKGLRGRL
jgi:hypothetical protein